MPCHYADIKNRNLTGTAKIEIVKFKKKFKVFTLAGKNRSCETRRYVISTLKKNQCRKENVGCSTAYPRVCQMPLPWALGGGEGRRW